MILFLNLKYIYIYVCVRVRARAFMKYIFNNTTNTIYFTIFKVVYCNYYNITIIMTIIIIACIVH